MIKHRVIYQQQHGIGWAEFMSRADAEAWRDENAPGAQIIEVPYEDATE